MRANPPAHDAAAIAEIALVDARENACRMFRSHDWRCRELREGRWDHHPDLREAADAMLLARASLAQSKGEE